MRQNVQTDFTLKNQFPLPRPENHTKLLINYFWAIVDTCIAIHKGSNGTAVQLVTFEKCHKFNSHLSLRS